MRLLTTVFLFFCISSSQGSELYFLCGPDEDGCLEDDYTACACLPHDAVPSTPHCLDFDKMRCAPLSEKPNCNKEHVFNNQGECLATMFHSTRTKPCRVKPRSFCMEHHIQFCDYNADPNNCHFARAQYKKAILSV